MRPNDAKSMCRQDDMTPPTPLQSGLRGLCPRCAAPTLFAGPIRFAERCPACGLDIAAFNVGDGPAAFLTLVIGALVAALAITLELAASPPWWVHALLWPPVTLALILGSLRIAKGWLLALEYRNAAREGRVVER
jgi:uncharacterized protein (DUF983 family)